MDENIIEIYSPVLEKNIKVRDIKIIFYDGHNKDGEFEKVKTVEFTVVGQNRTWTNFLPYEDFVKANPNVKIT